MSPTTTTTVIGIYRAMFAVAMLIVLLGVVMALRTSDVAAASGDPTVALTPAPGAHPYVSGQMIAISVVANSHFTPNARIEILECAAPHGVAPIDDTSCDGNTTPGQSVLVGPDGSFSDPEFTVYQLPSTALGEQSNHLPVCSADQECVLYVGQDQNDFTQPKVFSAPFTVGSSSQGPTTSATTNPVVGASSSSSVTSAPTSSSAASSSAVTLPPAGTSFSSGSGTSSSSGSLAFTGAPQGLLWTIAAGVVMMLTGGAGRLVGRRLGP